MASFAIEFPYFPWCFTWGKNFCSCPGRMAQWGEGWAWQQCQWKNTTDILAPYAIFFRVLGYIEHQNMFCTHIPVSELLSAPSRSCHPLSFSVNTDSPAETVLFVALPSLIHLQRHLEKQFIYTQKYLWSLNTLHVLALLLQLREATSANIGQEKKMYSASQSYQKSPVN